ncbi:MAG TPA: Fic family protein [Bacteriovoracaceae bacterium]|nr:Fic family protein [Bacteriovoracaceae bacterium]
MIIDKPLLDRIESKFKIVKKHRPLSSTIVNKLKEQFAIEMTYNSNAIEGNRLSLKETYLVIEEGITVKGKSLKEHLEAKNHFEAINFLYDLIEHDKKHTISEQLIRSLQQLIVKESDPSIAGSYRTGSVMISGSKHHPPDACDISFLMRDLVRWAQKNAGLIHIIELSAIFHHKIVHIHPFFDGNGRTARLAMNLLLMQHGYPLVIILKNDRKKYYDVLEKADAGKMEPLIKFVAQAIEKSLNIYLNAIGDSAGNKKLYSLSEIAMKTPYSEKYLNLLARYGKIDAHKDGRNWVSSFEAIENYQKNRLRKRNLKSKKTVK